MSHAMAEPRAVDGIGLIPGAHEVILHHLLGVAERPGDAHGDGHQHQRYRVMERQQRRAITLRHPLQQLIGFVVGHRTVARPVCARSNSSGRATPRGSFRGEASMTTILSSKMMVEFCTGENGGSRAASTIGM
jgi:hypothetical protein